MARRVMAVGLTTAGLFGVLVAGVGAAGAVSPTVRYASTHDSARVSQALTAAATTRSGECLSAPVGIGAATAARIPGRSKQVVLAIGQSTRSSYSTVQYWRRSAGCWRMEHSVAGRNGYAGWHPRPWDGSGYSPIGVFGLTDAGGRRRNPGTKLPYHYGPNSYAAGGYRMNNNSTQVFDYVVAVNFNRYVGRPPRDDGRPNPRIPDGGIWFHVAGAGATRGCISVSKRELVWALRWLDPAARPVIVMGPASRLAR